MWALYFFGGCVPRSITLPALPQQQKSTPRTSVVRLIREQACVDMPSW